MNILLILLSALPVTTYFFVVIVLLLLAVLMLVKRPSEFWCLAATLINATFLVFLYLADITSNEVLIGALVLVPLWFYILTAVSHLYPLLTPKVEVCFEILVFIVMVIVFCIMFEHIYVFLCHNWRSLLQGLLWLLGKMGVVDLQYNRTTALVYHIIVCLTTSIVLFSFSVAIYLGTPFVLAFIRRVKSKCIKFWEEKP
jgi:hypothetical protein